MIRIRLLKPCADGVIRQMDKDEVPTETKENRAKLYCECLINKIKEPDLVKIGNGENNFWDLVTLNYKKESLDCVEGSLKVDNGKKITANWKKS